MGKVTLIKYHPHNIPTWVGKMTSRIKELLFLTQHPHLGGENACSLTTESFTYATSPLVWGTHLEQ